MLGKVIAARVAPAGLSPVVRAAAGERTASYHELILKGLARKAARHESKPKQYGKLLLNAWHRGEHGLSRQLQPDGSYRYHVIGRLCDKLPNIK